MLNIRTRNVSIQAAQENDSCKPSWRRRISLLLLLEVGLALLLLKIWCFTQLLLLNAKTERFSKIRLRIWGPSSLTKLPTIITAAIVTFTSGPLFAASEIKGKAAHVGDADAFVVHDISVRFDGEDEPDNSSRVL